MPPPTATPLSTHPNEIREASRLIRDTRFRDKLLLPFQGVSYLNNNFSVNGPYSHETF